MTNDEATTYVQLAAIFAGWAVCYLTLVIYVVRKLREIDE